MTEDQNIDPNEIINQKHLERIRLEIQRFQEKVAEHTEDSEQFMTLMEMEAAMSELRNSTQKIYSDILSDTLESLDEKPVIDKKKENSKN